MKRYRMIETWSGPFVLFEDEDGAICTSWMVTGIEEQMAGARRDARLHPSVADRIERYFRGEEVQFEDVPVPGGTAFQQECWQACRAIPHGETRSYADLAMAVGRSRAAARAVGQAMRNNPQPVITPCHRIVGSDGDLHGFAGSDDPAGPAVGMKRLLLRLEGALRPATAAR